ncbi:tyrosine-type recombinase/integrase [Eudoraea adriatica]|uniref:tyrosine-type recombinase/integrase n=1 Tax=Eudoraea adriatica TaxID=446681 RepID=UPI000363925B|nr:tyrosine-type recombinase/integrase [Eudoraea adriatica]
MSLAAFISYLTYEKNYSPNTVKAYEKDIQGFANFCIKEYDLKEIEQVEYNLIRGWVVQMVTQGLSNRSVNRKIASLKAYYKFLLKTENIRVNPLAKHKALKTPAKIEVPFSEKEMELLLQQVHFEDGFEGYRDRLIIELLYTTGIRRAELINLRLKDIELSQKTMKVLGKRNKERIVPLLDPTINLFKIYLDERMKLESIKEMDFVFLAKSGVKIYETLVYRIINGYFSKVSSKVKKSPHILRHTFATHLLNKGADLNSVKELLGHASLASTQVYTHNSIAELKKVHASAHPRSKK